MFKWANAVVVSVAGLSLAACAGSGADGTDPSLGEKSSELVAPAQCQDPSDCPVPFIACRECPDGVNFSCPEAECNSGRCGVTFTACPNPEPELIFCGGIAGIRCPDGLDCVDDPRDESLAGAGFALEQHRWHHRAAHRVEDGEPADLIPERDDGRRGALQPIGRVRVGTHGRCHTSRSRARASQARIPMASAPAAACS